MVGSPGSSLECPGAMRRLSQSRCEVCLLRGVGCEPVGRRSCRSRSSSLNGWGAYKACHRRTMSPCPVVVGVFLYPGCTPVVPVELKRPSAL